MVMAVSSNSRFDKFRRNEPGGVLSQDELEGYAILTKSVPHVMLQIFLQIIALEIMV